MKKILVLAYLLFAASTTSAAEQSCAEQLGAEQAAELVHRCISVSPATYPPCNAANSCEIIQSEIDRGCTFFRNEPDKPKYCSSHLSPARP